MISFEKLTIILPASNEQESLRDALRCFSKICDPQDIKEVIVFLKSKDCPSKKVLDKILSEESFSFVTREYVQATKGADKIMLEAPLLVDSSHFIIFYSDLETDPSSVPKLIKISKTNPEAIVCASKFKKGATRKGYDFFHMHCTRFVNLIVAKIIGSTGTELISPVQIYPTEIYRKMNFQPQRKSFYGFTIKPIIEGIEYIEIPTNYVRRNKGKSNLNIFSYIKFGIIFISTAIKLKWDYEKDKRKIRNNN